LRASSVVSFSFFAFCCRYRFMLDPPTTAAPTPQRELSVRAQQDLVLVAAALNGQSQAYEALLNKYRQSVYYVVFKLVRHAEDAEDLTLEAFAKAFRHLPRYSPDFAFSTWLFRIATNHSIDFIRRNRLETLSLDAPRKGDGGNSLGWEVCDPAPDPQEACIREQRLALMRQVVGLLPAKYARLVELRYFKERSYDELAAELQLPLGTVKAQLFQARKLMLRLVKDSQAAL
jgi:RNA polymerase sigma-70 factor (ECF subfamily)